MAIRWPTILRDSVPGIAALKQSTGRASRTNVRHDGITEMRPPWTKRGRCAVDVQLIRDGAARAAERGEQPPATVDLGEIRIGGTNLQQRAIPAPLGRNCTARYSSSDPRAFCSGIR